MEVTRIRTGEERVRKENSTNREASPCCRGVLHESQWCIQCWQLEIQERECVKCAEILSMRVKGRREELTFNDSIDGASFLTELYSCSTRREELSNSHLVEERERERCDGKLTPQ